MPITDKMLNRLQILEEGARQRPYSADELAELWRFFVDMAAEYIRRGFIDLAPEWAGEVRDGEYHRWPVRYCVGLRRGIGGHPEAGAAHSISMALQEAIYPYNSRPYGPELDRSKPTNTRELLAWIRELDTPPPGDSYFSWIRVLEVLSAN